ncbi:hypothetical protein GQ54DRAFT_292533 [Martensiomyces pterosporus]|nr:hypothetical protein GQ54DRAFT_292533 [Martensiomyces pterosporus]
MVGLPSKSLVVGMLGLIAQAFEVQLEWDIIEGTKDVTTAMSLLRFANDTSPPATEWTGIGWDSGSISLQHRRDSSTLVVMQIFPPTRRHQVILGKASELAEARYRPTTEGPSQVFLESKVELDATLPYYFKVEAHHDMKDNRTTYEGLYSVGNSWIYMGSLILQHPNNGPSILSQISIPSSSAAKDTARNDKDTTTSADSLKSAEEATTKEKSKSPDSGDDSDKDDSDKDDSDDDNKEAENERDSDVMCEMAGDDSSANESPDAASKPLSTSIRSAFLSFLRSSVGAIRSRDKRNGSSSTVARAIDNHADSNDAANKVLELLKNGVKYPDFPVFPKIYSGVKRLPGGNSNAMRAGVYKKFELRDRLGQMYFISHSHAYSYDSKDSDIVYVRHYFMSASYLVSIDGTRNPGTAKNETTSAIAESSASSASPASPASSPSPASPSPASPSPASSSSSSTTTGESA